MENLRFSGKIGGHNAYLCRIDKRKARALFELGRTIYLVPGNFAPLGAWIQPFPVKINNPYSWTNDFNLLVKEFTYYNCVSNETGYYPAYYIDLNSNESNPLIKL